MKKTLYILLFLVSNLVFAQSTTKNYIVTQTYNEPVVESELGSLSKDDIMTDIMYFDGLGRELQNIQLRAGGRKEDIITHYEYDYLGRQEKTFLPFSNGSDNPLFRMGNVDEQTQLYYKNNFASDFNGITNTTNINSYLQKEYDGSPLGKVTKQAAPGENWKLGNGKEIKTEYEHNSANEVKIYSVTTTFSDNVYIPTLVGGTMFYEEGKLYKSIVKDENWESGTNNTIEIFKNKDGKIILKRHYNNGPLDTYYVYDDYDNLTFVLPPNCNANSVVPTQNILNELSYQYVYDYRNRIVEKKLPGKGKEYIVYDNLNRPILTQDSNLKTKRQWLFTKFDIHSRVAYTGIYTDSADRGRAAMQAYITNLIDAETDVNKRNKMLYETRVTTGAGEQNCYYTNNNFPKLSIEILKANYYDTYISGINRIGTGFLTGTKTKVLGSTNDWSYTEYHYDTEGRIVLETSKLDYRQSANTLVYTDINYTYNFAGQITKKITRKTKGKSVIQVNDLYKYDHRRRLIRHNQCVGETYENDLNEANISDINYRQSLSVPTCDNNTTIDYNLILKDNINAEIAAATNLKKEAENSITLRSGFEAKPQTGQSLLLKINDNASGELIASYTYDDLGQNTEKKIGNNENSPLQKIDYAYNVRGWLTKINNDTHTDNDLFNATLHYNKPLSGGTPLYNGNISSVSWSTKNYDSSTKIYNYSYDALNRLTAAIHNDYRYSVSGITYDKNGNIKTLNRKGYYSTTATNSFMDKLNYIYQANSNKLITVNDAGNTDSNNGFKTATSSYTYDDNGNLKTDSGKGINSITYNYLNLPNQINFSNGKRIEYKYDAKGTKIAKFIKEQNGTPINTTVYINEFLYSSTSTNALKLDVVQHPEGYIERQGAVNQEGTFNYFYNHKDHLGNIRLVFGDRDNNKTIEENEIAQENNYYPFGLRHRGDNNDIISPFRNAVASRFMFGGKEVSEELGLDTYDFGARNYDAALGRWMNIDPLAEQMRRHSPYNYAFNNPLRFIDPDGMAPNDVIIKGTASQKAFELLQASVNSELTLTMDSNGNVTYTQNEPEVTLSSDAQQLVNAIDDNSIFVNILSENTQFTESGNLYIGGAFSGNDVMQHDIVNLVSTTQEVNPNVLGEASKAHGKEGANMLHEVTESYLGALTSQKTGVSSPSAGKQGSVYPGAHASATPQSGDIFETLYDANGNVLQMQNGQYPSNVAKVDWWVKDTDDNPVIIQTLE